MEVDEEVVIDSLPYIDETYTPEAAVAAQKAIDECNTNSPFPHPKLGSEHITFSNNKIIRDELERVEKGIQMDAINLQKFRLEPPREGENASVDDWERSVMNAQAQLENQYVRIVNLELMVQFCKNSWIIHNYQLEQCRNLFSKQLEDLESSVQLIHKQRKADQMRHARSLQVLTYAYPTPFER